MKFGDRLSGLRLLRTLALGASLAVPAFVATSASSQTIADVLKAPPGGGDPVVARVNGVELKRSDVLSTLQNMPPQVMQMPIATVYPLLLDRMVDGKLITAAGRAAKLNDDAEVKKKVSDYEDRVIQETYLNRAVKAKLTDDVLRKKYQAFLTDNPPQEEVHARHILVATEAQAKDVIAELKKGGDFAAIAKAKSTDGSAKEGGDLGFFTREEMVPEFSEVAFALKPGEVSKDPVKTQFGFHVIKVEERRKSAPPSFEDSKEQLSSDMSQELIAGVVDELRGKAKIERFDIDGKPLPAADAAPKPAPAK